MSSGIPEHGTSTVTCRSGRGEQSRCNYITVRYVKYILLWSPGILASLGTCGGELRDTLQTYRNMRQSFGHPVMGTARQWRRRKKPVSFHFLQLLPLRFIIFLKSETCSQLMRSPWELTATAQLSCESRTEGALLPNNHIMSVLPCINFCPSTSCWVTTCISRQVNPFSCLLTWFSQHLHLVLIPNKLY